MPVREDAAVQLSRWNAEAVRARSLVLAAMAVVVEGKEREPPVVVDTTPNEILSTPAAARPMAVSPKLVPVVELLDQSIRPVFAIIIAVGALYDALFIRTKKVSKLLALI